MMVYIILNNIIYIKKESSKCSLTDVVLCDSDILNSFEIPWGWEIGITNCSGGFTSRCLLRCGAATLHGGSWDNWMENLWGIYPGFWVVIDWCIECICHLLICNIGYHCNRLQDLCINADISLGKSAKNSQESTCKKQHTIYWSINNLNTNKILRPIPVSPDDSCVFETCRRPSEWLAAFGTWAFSIRRMRRNGSDLVFSRHNMLRKTYLECVVEVIVGLNTWMFIWSVKVADVCRLTRDTLKRSRTDQKNLPCCGTLK